ncbi:hypothetical protein BGZ73_008987 [Actinomortierella ambigua]|nr:hypothetical protein BGZ73_008987 [Actinomortierella ambigua]
MVIARLVLPRGYRRIREMKLIAEQGVTSIDMLGPGQDEGSSGPLLVSNGIATRISRLFVNLNAGTVKLNRVLTTDTKISGTDMEVVGIAYVQRELIVSTTTGNVDLEVSPESYKDRVEVSLYSTSGSVQAIMNSYRGYFSLQGQQVVVEGNPLDIHFTFASLGVTTGWVTPGGRKPSTSSEVKLQSTGGNATVIFR